MRTIGLDDLDDLCRGAAILGTGGGGDPYIGGLLAAGAIRTNGPATLWSLDETPDDALIVAVGGMGAPTVAIEKIPNGDEYLWALEALERQLGRQVDAVIPFEAGGMNSTIPVMVAARRGLPVVDGDGMGRAFPELQMETFNVYGVPAAPMAVVNEWGDSVVIEAREAKMVEWLARGVTIRMGGHTAIAEYAMDGATARRVSMPATLSLTLNVGRWISDARAGHTDVLQALIDGFAGTHYQHAKLLFKGKLTDVSRRTERGFAIGQATIEGIDGWTGSMLIQFQNENLVARHDGVLRAIVPDLICILDSEKVEAVTTERLRYGQRVSVLGVSVPEIMRTPEALAVFGPAAFGLDEPFVPIERLAG
ncbi:MAG: DUF917 domain-containing protein [Hyphomicrobiales bacterium]|nr:DUF917 domain-containing protein [Hyphomicrobiales bacterium]